MQNPKNIILINGVPRSGTSWLGQIIDSSPEVRYKFQPLFSNSFKNYIDTNSTKDDIIDFFQSVFNYEDEFLDRVSQKSKGIHETFQYKNISPSTLAIKHVRYHYLLPQILKNVDNIQVMCIVRNPCATINSWRRSPKEFRHIDGIFSEQWRFAQLRNEFRPEEYFGFHRWKEAVKLFLTIKQWYPEKVTVIKYENLAIDPHNTTKSIFDFLNLQIHEQTTNFLKKSTELNFENEYSVFKGDKKLDDWKEELDIDIINEIFEELKGTEFEEFLV